MDLFQKGFDCLQRTTGREYGNNIMQDLLGMKGRSILITGGSRGPGGVMALGFAEK